MMDGVIDGLEDSDGCYSSSEDDWENCNNDDDRFDIDADDDDAGDDEDDDETPVSLMHEVQNRTAAQVDDVSSMVDKENDFNLKVIASCGDNIIAVANPALMNRNQPTITKEQPIKEEIALRDRRD